MRVISLHWSVLFTCYICSVHLSVTSTTNPSDMVLNFTWWVQWVVTYTSKQLSILAVIYQRLQYFRVFISYLQLASHNKKHAVVFFSFRNEKAFLQFTGVYWKFLEFLYLLSMFWVSSFIECNVITCSSICPDCLCSCNKKSRKL